MDEFDLDAFVNAVSSLQDFCFEDGDVIVRFDADNVLLLHSRLLSERSKVFKAMLDKRWCTPYLVKVRCSSRLISIHSLWDDLC